MYTIGDENKLIALVETPYERELDLQRALADHPELLAGDQMNPVDPRRFVLVTSEAGIAISETSGSAFFLDLLYLDQDAVPTLVEVKRGTDTRIRREVVGQLLEYAANVCAFWTAERMRSVFDATCIKRGLIAQNEIEKRLGVLGIDEYESFWHAVRSNLERQQLRLVLIADAISTETLRIIEYLNRQMGTSDVFAVAIPQFAGGSFRAIVPRVLNSSLVEVDRKRVASSTRGEPWTRERFYAELERQGHDATSVFSAIESWAMGRSGVDVAFGKGATIGSMRISCLSNEAEATRSATTCFLTLWTSGGAEIEFEYIAKVPPFDELRFRQQLLERLNAIGSFSIAEEHELRNRPNISYRALSDPAPLQAFLDVQEWLVETFASSAATVAE